MSSEMVFAVLVIILFLHFMVDRLMDVLYLKGISPVIPEKLQDFYDEKQYAEFISYRRRVVKVGIYDSLGSFIFLMLFLFTGFFGRLNEFVVSWVDNPIWQCLVFVWILSLMVTIYELPFDWYRTFRIEEEFDFNRTTMNTFASDSLKGFLLSMVIDGLAVAVIAVLYRWGDDIGPLFWLDAWAVLTFISLVIAMFHSNLIVPLFNKQTPLESGSLRDKIEAFALQVGFKIKDIYVMDASRRSTKANAYFTGLGSKKRIVLYDTLLLELSDEEIVAVLAHEIGHYEHRHVWQMMLISSLEIGFMLWLFSLVVNESAFSEALGADQVYFQLGLLTFTLLYTPVYFIFHVMLNALSRKNEYQADEFAGRNYDPDKLISALKKISVKSFSDLTPHPLYELVYHSHPSLLKRIDHLSNIK